MAELTPDVTGFTDTNVVNGTTYAYTVRAVRGTEESVNSNTASATPQAGIIVPPPTAPLAPTGLSGIGGDLVASLSWTRSTSTGVTEQRIYRNGGRLLSGTLGPLTQSFNDVTVTNNVTYTYTVRAVRGSESLDSNQVSVMPNGATIPGGAPAAPTFLRAVSSDHQIVLTWTPNTDASITQQRVYRYLPAFGDAGSGSLNGNADPTGIGWTYTTPLAPVAPGVGTYTDTGLTTGQVYFYVVRSFNGAESWDSNQVLARPTPTSYPGGTGTITVSSQSVTTHGTVTATVSGVDNAGLTDYVAIYNVGAPLTYFYTFSSGSPLNQPTAEYNLLGVNHQNMGAGIGSGSFVLKMDYPGPKVIRVVRGNLGTPDVPGTILAESPIVLVSEPPAVFATALAAWERRMDTTYGPQLLEVEMGRAVP